MLSLLQYCKYVYFRDMWEWFCGFIRWLVDNNYCKIGWKIICCCQDIANLLPGYFNLAHPVGVAPILSTNTWCFFHRPTLSCSAKVKLCELMHRYLLHAKGSSCHPNNSVNCQCTEQWLPVMSSDWFSFLHDKVGQHQQSKILSTPGTPMPETARSKFIWLIFF